jgi:hypothetical protein
MPTAMQYQRLNRHNRNALGLCCLKVAAIDQFANQNRERTSSQPSNIKHRFWHIFAEHHAGRISEKGWKGVRSLSRFGFCHPSDDAFCSRTHPRDGRNGRLFFGQRKIGLATMVQQDYEITALKRFER